MATAENKLFSPIKWTVKANATAGNASASKSAPGAGLRHYIVGFVVSTSATSTAASSLDFSDNGTSVFNIDLPVGLSAQPVVIMFSRPYECVENGTAVAVVGSFGAALVGRVNMLGFTA